MTTLVKEASQLRSTYSTPFSLRDWFTLNSLPKSKTWTSLKYPFDFPPKTYILRIREEDSNLLSKRYSRVEMPSIGESVASSLISFPLRALCVERVKIREEDTAIVCSTKYPSSLLQKDHRMALNKDKTERSLYHISQRERFLWSFSSWRACVLLPLKRTTSSMSATETPFTSFFSNSTWESQLEDFSQTVKKKKGALLFVCLLDLSRMRLYTRSASSTTGRSRMPNSFWTIQKNQREFLDELGTKLGILKLEDWYSMKTSDIINAGGRKLINQFRSSLCLTLMSAYPEFKWEPWRFKNTPRGYWESPENGKSYLDWVGEKFGIEDVRDWWTKFWECHLKEFFRQNVPKDALQVQSATR